MNRIIYLKVIKTILAFTWCSNSSCYSTCIKVEMKAQQRRKYNKAILIYRCLNIQLEGLDPNYLRHSEIRYYDAKNKDKFLLPKPRPEYMKHIFKYNYILVSLCGTHYPKMFKALILHQASKDN